IIDAVRVEDGLEDDGHRRDHDGHRDRADDQLDDERPSSHPGAAGGGEVELDRPAGEGEAGAMQAAAQIIGELGLILTIEQIAVERAEHEAQHRHHDGWLQISPHRGPPALWNIRSRGTWPAVTRQIVSRNLARVRPASAYGIPLLSFTFNNKPEQEYPRKL